MTFPGRRSHRRDGEELIRSLYRDHGRSLLAYTLRLTGDRGIAEDVVQETLIRAWKNAEKLHSGQGSVRGWLLTVARNIVTDRVRARASRPQEVGGDYVDVPAESRDPADEVVDMMVVLGALDGLSAEHREVLVATYYRGQTVAEAARTLGIPPGTVKSRTYHALRALRAALSGGRR